MLKRISQSCAQSCAMVLAVILSSLPSGATQIGTGSLSCTVKDPAGAVIVGAQVTIRNDATGESRSAATNNEGRFKFDNLAPGSYTVSVAQAGFKAAERAITVDPRRPLRLKFS